MAPRIILCGDVLGRLNQLFKRVSSVNKSAGPFDALLCVGQFFPDSPEQLDEFMAYIEDNEDWRSRKHSKEEEMKIMEDFKS